MERIRTGRLVCGAALGWALLLLGPGTVNARPRMQSAPPPTAIDFSRSRQPLYLDGGTAMFFGSNYRAKFEDGSLTFVAGAPDRWLRYRLSEITSGPDTLLSPSGAAPSIRLEGTATLVVDRGPVVELYEHRSGGVEQSFRILQRPAGKGDLVVRGPVMTNLQPPPDGCQGPALAFQRDGKDALTIREAVAFDAVGRKLALEIRYAGGDLVLQVPEEWMKAATFPVTVDPVIGSEFTVDTASSFGPEENEDAWLFTIVDIAYNPTADEYFVMWNELFALGGTGTASNDSDVWCCRVNAATGTIASASFSVSNPHPLDFGATVQAGEGRTAYNATLNQYLSVYRATMIPAVPELSQIRGRITNADGSNVGGTSTSSPTNAGFTINADQTDAISDTQPCVASSATAEWMVIWARTDATVGTSDPLFLAGRLVTGVASFNGATFTGPGTATELEYRPAIAYSAVSGNYLIAWDTAYPSTAAQPVEEIFAATASTSSPPVFGATTAVSTAGGAAGWFADVAADPVNSEFLVVWEEVLSGFSSAFNDDSDVLGRTLSATTGAALSAVTTLEGGANIDGKPRAASSICGGAYVVAFHRITPPAPAITETNILASRFALSTLAALETDAIVAGAAGIDVYAAVAVRTTPPTQALIAYERFGAATFDPFAIRFDVPPVPTALPFVPASLAQRADVAGPDEPVGFTDNDRWIVFRATVTDPDAGHQVRLQVEVVPNAGSFPAPSISTGNWVPSAGGTSQVSAKMPADGDYKWRARAEDCEGGTSAWVEFDPGPAADFNVLLIEREGDNGDQGCHFALVRRSSRGLPLAAAILIPLLLVALRRR